MPDMESCLRDARKGIIFRTAHAGILLPLCKTEQRRHLHRFCQRQIPGTAGSHSRAGEKILFLI